MRFGPAKKATQVAIINSTPILIDEENWVRGASAINAILTLPVIPGFPDYRWHGGCNSVYSTQTQGRIKRLTSENIDFQGTQGFKLWVDGEHATLPPSLIRHMIERGGKTKHEFRASKDLGVLVLRDGKPFGQFNSQAAADAAINKPGIYQVYELDCEYEVGLTVHKRQVEPIQGQRFYGIDE